MVKFPCYVCEKPVAHTHKAICCDLCQTWVHIKCNNLSKKNYIDLKRDQLPWYCKICLQKEISFTHLNNDDFKEINHILDNATKSSRMPPSLLQKMNNISLEENLLCKYYTCEELNNLTKSKKIKDLTFMHLNISSLTYHIDEISELLNSLNKNL